MRSPLILTTALLLAACSSQAADPAPALAAERSARHPLSALEIIPLTATTADGAEYEFAVEVARTPMEQAQGLMFRTRMGSDEGMLFPRDPPRVASFWMKNTVLPLDIIFIGPDNRVINVAANTVPYSEDPVISEAPAAAVLELNAGRAAELGIGPGALVRW